MRSSRKPLVNPPLKILGKPFVPRTCASSCEGLASRVGALFTYNVLDVQIFGKTFLNFKIPNIINF